MIRLARKLVALAALSSIGIAACGPPPKSFVIPSSVLEGAFHVALGGTKLQVSQNDETPVEIAEGQSQCKVDDGAVKKCQMACDMQMDNVAACYKGCTGKMTCMNVCGMYTEHSYIQFSKALEAAAGTQGCNPADCQTCTKDANGQSVEPALFDRALTGIPYPLVTTTAGAITYHCYVTRLRFDIDAQFPVAVDQKGIHFTLPGTDDSPAITCDNGAPAIDVDSPTVTIDLVPSVPTFGDGNQESVIATAHAQFTGNVSAHDKANPFDDIVTSLDNAQQLVTSHATSAMDAQVQMAAPAFGRALWALIVAQAPEKIDPHLAGISYDTNGLTVSYWPAQ